MNQERRDQSMTGQRQRRGSGGIPIRQGGPRPNEQFTIISNANIRNPGLSGMARAVHAYLLSLPADWHVTADTVAEQGFPLDSREKIRRAFRELRAAGFLLLMQDTDNGGQVVKWYAVHHDAQPLEDARIVALSPDAVNTAAGPTRQNVTSLQVRPAAGKPAAGKPAAGKPAGNRKTGVKDGSEDHQGAGPHPSWLTAALPDLDDSEISAILARLDAERHPGNLMGYVRALAENGDLAAYAKGQRCSPIPGSRRNSECGRPTPQARMANACLNGQADDCTATWCECWHHVDAAGAARVAL